MKIKMKTLQAGPGGTRQPDHVYSVSNEEARALITGGYAVEVKELPKVEPAAELIAEPVVEAAPEFERAESRKPSRKATRTE